MSWKKERTVMVLFDAANAYEFRTFPLERFRARLYRVWVCLLALAGTSPRLIQLLRRLV